MAYVPAEGRYDAMAYNRCGRKSEDCYLVPVAINLSTAQFADSSLPERLETLLAEFGIAPALIELELTETALIDADNQSFLDLLTRLHKMGVRLAIDDFGTGFSNLNTLHRLPVNRIKIDRSFVTGLGLHANSSTIVEAVVRMANELQVEVLAEGVETVHQARLLIDRHCAIMQGFLFGRPTPPNQVCRMLKQVPSA